MTGYILYKAVNIFFQIYYVLILGNVLFSFVRPRPYTFLDQLARATYQLTEPLMGPIRRAMPNMGPLDFSPFIALIALNIIQKIVMTILGLIF